MANALEAAFNRHLKKHFPDDEDNSDEDFEEELMKKSKKKMKELPKPKKPGHFVDNFVRESGGMNRGSPNPPQLHNMAQAMAPMQPFYSNHLPSMNQMTGRGMMAPNHPSRFPYHPTAHFSPDGRPLYPPQFYQNFNRGMSPYGMPHHPQYNQFAHMASQMARPQGMQGYPNAMMQGHVRFPPNVRENSMDGYKKSELEHPVSPQVSIPAVSTSGEVTPSSETSELNEPDTAKPESQEQRLSEAASGMGPHVRPKSFEQGDSRKGPPLSARPVDFGQQLPVGYGNQQLRQRGYFSPRSQVPMQLQARADSYMQRMPVSAGSRMPFSGAPGSYQQNQSRQQMPVLKHIREQNVPPSHEQQANDQSVPRSVKSSANAITNKHQSPAPTKSTMDQSVAKSSISPPRKHESEEEEVPFPFIIRPGKNKKLEHDGETIRKDSSERQKEKQPVSSSSENELQESDKQTSARKPLGFPVSQLLNDPSDTSSKSPGQETVTRPGGQPSVIKSTAAVTPSPTTHQPRLPEDRSPCSDDSTVGKSLSSRAYPPMASMQSSPSLDRPTPGRGYPGVKPLQNRQNNRKEHSSRVDSGMDASLRNQLADKTEPGRGYPNLETSHNTNREGPLRGYTSVEHSRNPALFKEWSSSVQGCDAARPRSFLEELNGDDFPPPRGYPEFPHSGRSGVDLSNHHLPFTSLLKEMAPPHGAVYSKPREPNRTDSMYGKNYTDRDSLKESFPSGRNQLHSPEVDPRHGDRQHASYEDNLYGNDKRASHAMPPLFRPSNGANQDLSSSGPPKEFGKSSGVAVSSERQLIDLDSVPYRRAMYQSSEGAYNRDALFLASQRGQQPPTQGTPPNISPTMSQIFPGPPGGQGGPPMMGYSAMLRQHQLFEAAYASHMVRNGEYPMSRVEDGVPSKVPRFS